MGSIVGKPKVFSSVGWYLMAWYSVNPKLGQ